MRTTRGKRVLSFLLLNIEVETVLYRFGCGENESQVKTGAKCVKGLSSEFETKSTERTRKGLFSQGYLGNGAWISSILIPHSAVVKGSRQNKTGGTTTRTESYIKTYSQVNSFGKIKKFFFPSRSFTRPVSISNEGRTVAATT